MESAHHFSSRPDCNNTADVPSSFQRTALSAFPFVSNLCGVDGPWFNVNSSQTLPNSKELSVQMTFGFLVGSMNFCKLFCVSWEVFVLHGQDCIHWVPKSCTTTAYRWLCRDSHPSLRTLWSAVIKSPNFPLWARLYQHVSCKRSPRLSSCRYRNSSLSGNEKNLSSLGTTFARGSKGNSWEELGDSRCCGTHSSVNPSLNSCSQTSTPWNSSSSSKSSSSFFIWVFDFCWFTPRVSSCWWVLARTFTSSWCWNFRVSHNFLRWRCGRSRWTRGTRG